MNEATARIKINHLLEATGWRFFADAGGPANIRLEQQVALKPTDLDGLGDDFENADKGFVDFLLLDSSGFPLIVLEAKSARQRAFGRQGASKELRPLAELPLRHTVQRQPALFLGPGARQPPYHHAVPYTGIINSLQAGEAEPSKAGR